MLTTSDEKLLEKFLEDQCTPKEARDVLEWLSSPEGRLIAENRFDRDIVLMENPDQNLDSPEVRTAKMFRLIMEKIYADQAAESTLHIRRLFPNWLKLAAAIFIPLLITNAIIWYLLEKPNSQIAWQEVYVPKGEKQQVIFQDGTRVWLNSDTKLTYPVEFAGNQREVKLDGEAYFMVKKNPKKPFIVKLNNLSIKVTGTSFNVKAYNDEKLITTTLDEGKISLLTKQKNEPVEYALLPGQEAFYSKTNSDITVVKSVVDQNSSWKEKKLTFKNTPFLDVVKTLERWYNVKFIIMDQKLSRYTYTITFRNEPLQNVLFAMEKITPIRCHLNNGSVEIDNKNYKKINIK